VERWRRLYDIDFTPLLDAAIPGPTHTITEAEVVATWPPVGPPVVLATVDLTTFEEPSLEAFANLHVDVPGLVNAVALTFCAHLHGDISHSLDPWTWPSSSWGTSVWVLPDPVALGPRTALRVHYHRRIEGFPDGLSCTLVDDLA